jgi:glutamyl-tRNA synthetase
LATVDAMIEAFDLSSLNSSPAAFDEKKLLSFNGFYLRRLPEKDFVDRTMDWLRANVVEPLAPVLQERADRLPAAIGMVDFFMHDEPVLELESWQKVMEGDAADSARAVLEAAVALYEDEELSWDHAALHDRTEALAEERGMKLGKLQAPIRVAVTGRRVGPPLFESLEVLGRAETLTRLQRALERLGRAS